MRFENLLEQLEKFVSLILKPIVLGNKIVQKKMPCFDELPNCSRKNWEKVKFTGLKGEIITFYQSMPVGEKKTFNNKTNCIVYFHGITRNYVEHYNHFKNLHVIEQKVNFCFVLIEYRGFDDFKGDFTPENVVEDTHDILTYIKNKHKGNLMLVGNSFGTGVVLKYCSYVFNNNLINLYDSIVLIAPFTSFINAAKHNNWYVVFNMVLPLDRIMHKELDFNNSKNILCVMCNKILIFDAFTDVMVGENSGYSLYKSIFLNKNADYFKVIGSNHDSIINNEFVWGKTLVLLDSN
jgi:predicted alpha/beta-fold hydrolase